VIRALSARSSTSHEGQHVADRSNGVWALTAGSVGVVFGDIGTSPIYAVREALAHSSGSDAEATVLGVISLIFWALTLIVTLKYVVFVLNADNKGEGGTLALMALAQRAVGRRTPLILVLGMCGAALFYGDSLITPAISVLSAAEGIVAAPGMGEKFQPFVIPTAGVILIGLFMVQSHGTARVGWYFGPIMVIWFLLLAGMGLVFIVQTPTVMRGFNPVYGIKLITDNGFIGLVILGSVFLAVTGAEALYADMGHFGKTPIRLAWIVLVFPALMLNYLGQGALVLTDPAARENPFFHMIPATIYWPVLVLTTTATVIASQAVITGAFSMTQQAVQVGLLPRLTIKRTSELIAGQIYVPSTNWLLMAGVLFLLAIFKNSSNLAAAYGIAVTATMVVTVLLFGVITRSYWHWPLALSLAIVGPFLLIDIVFLGANTLKIAQGGWFPLTLGAGLVLIMWTWNRGARIISGKTARDAVPLTRMIARLESNPPRLAKRTAIFLTPNPKSTPIALLHNLKHNQVLHEANIILTVTTADIPRVAQGERLSIEVLSQRFTAVSLSYGFMEMPDIPAALDRGREHGLRLDRNATSYFFGRHSVVASGEEGMPVWQDSLFIFLMKNAADPTQFYRIPPGQVVELGAQITV